MWGVILLDQLSVHHQLESQHTVRTRVLRSHLQNQIIALALIAETIVIAQVSGTLDSLRFPYRLATRPQPLLFLAACAAFLAASSASSNRRDFSSSSATCSGVICEK